MILPQNDFQGNSPGENYIWQKFQEILPESYVSFHNYSIDIKQPDIMLMVPDLGVLVIEIKSIKAKNVFDIPDNSIIRMKNSPPIPSPFAQATKYRNQLIDKLKGNKIENVFVIQSIAFPYISKEEFHEKNLDKICDERLTLLSEDFKSKESILKKIDEIFMLAYEKIAVPKLEKFGFVAELLLKVGNIISPDFLNTCFNLEDKTSRLDGVIEAQECNDENKHSFFEMNKPQYSMLRYYNNDSKVNEIEINELIRLWSFGTKVYFFSSDKDIIQKILIALEERIKNLGIFDRNAFKIDKFGTFNFNVSSAPNMDRNFEIINGIDQDIFKDLLTQLHNESSFNYDQYKIEHAPLENLIVKAGAGTGKTYSIISRIDYLVWKMDYTPSELSAAIAMITFTNESADAMRKKLQAHFISYYLLTRNIIFLEYTEAVEDMNIATIHSIAKLILQKYGSVIGLGKDFNIVTGHFQREKIIVELIDEQILKDVKFKAQIDSSEMKLFHFTKRVINLLEKLDNKNIDLTDDTIEYGMITPNTFNCLIDIMKSAQIKLNSSNDNFNKVSLGDIMRKLRKLCHSIMMKEYRIDKKIDFLFVDEFQDTDDVQIELIKSFQKLFGYKYFVVGDIKQCIYRFRGAEVKAFDTLSKGDTSETLIISLEKNYRTDSKLMAKFNEIFMHWNKRGLLEYGENDILVGTRTYGKAAEILSISHTGTDFDDKFVQLLKTESAKLGEDQKIAVLVRFNSQVIEVKQICEDQGLYIETEIGGELFSIDPTIDFFKLVLALRHYESPQHLFNLYSTSYVNEDLPKTSLWNLENKELTEYFYENLPKSLSKWKTYLEKLGVEPVLKVLRDILDDVRPWDIFSQKIKCNKEEAERNESYYIRNLDQLFEKLIEAANTDYLTINKIAEHLEIMILTRREEESRASYDVEKSVARIICTTVHKSKGLEFSTVVLPFTDFDIDSKRAKGDVDLVFSDNKLGLLVKDKDGNELLENTIYNEFEKNESIYRLHEEARILYVAMTRTIKRLVYFVETTSMRRKQESWKKLIEEVTL